MRPVFLVSASLVLLAGCGGSDLDDADDMRAWVNGGSALGVYVRAHDVVQLAEMHGGFPDAKCPTVVDDGTKVTVTGGCTDSRGEQFVGTATATRDADGARALAFDGYAHSTDAGLLAPLSGTFSYRPVDATTRSFDASFVQKGGTTQTIVYAGRVVGDFDARTTWSGSGTLERDGFGPTGKADVSTTDEVVDDAVCSGQPVSGQTRIELDEQVAVLTYDGATDCDPDQAATWTLDGEDQGKITGITCSTSAPGSGSSGLAGLVAAALVAWRRRRVTK